MKRHFYSRLRPANGDHDASVKIGGGLPREDVSSGYGKSSDRETCRSGECVPPCRDKARPEQSVSHGRHYSVPDDTEVLGDRWTRHVKTLQQTLPQTPSSCSAGDNADHVSNRNMSSECLAKTQLQSVSPALRVGVGMTRESSLCFMSPALYAVSPCHRNFLPSPCGSEVYRQALAELDTMSSVSSRNDLSTTYPCTELRSTCSKIPSIEGGLGRFNLSASPCTNDVISGAREDQKSPEAPWLSLPARCHAQFEGYFTVAGATHTIRVQSVNKSLNTFHLMRVKKSDPVYITINGQDLTANHTVNKTVIARHAIRRISYATWRSNLRLFAILARESRGHVTIQYCYVFRTTTSSEAEQLHSLVDSAFQLAYSSSLSTSNSSLAADDFSTTTATTKADVINNENNNNVSNTWDRLCSNKIRWHKTATAVLKSNSGPIAPIAYKRLNHPVSYHQLDLTDDVTSRDHSKNSVNSNRCGSDTRSQQDDDGHIPVLSDTLSASPSCNSLLDSDCRADVWQRSCGGNDSSFDCTDSSSCQESSVSNDATTTTISRDHNSQSAVDNEEVILRNASWFQPGIPREIALEVLAQEPLGSFLVRESTTRHGCFALTLRVPTSHHSSGIAHYLVLKNSRGLFKLKGFTKEFPSLTSLIVHHSVMPELLPIPLAMSRSSVASHQHSDSMQDLSELPSCGDLEELRSLNQSTSGVIETDV